MLQVETLRKAFGDFQVANIGTEVAEKLVRYSTEVNKGITPGGEVRGNGWWGHLHGTMDMAAGVAEFGRLTGRENLEFHTMMYGIGKAERRRRIDEVLALVEHRVGQAVGVVVGLDRGVAVLAAYGATAHLSSTEKLSAAPPGRAATAKRSRLEASPMKLALKNSAKKLPIAMPASVSAISFAASAL